MSLRRAALSLLIVAAPWLAGCGQTGPLYLPEEEAESGPAAEESQGE